MMLRLALLVMLSPALPALSCGDSSDTDNAAKACDIIVNECGAGSEGFTLDECVAKMRFESSDECSECVVGLVSPCAPVEGSGLPAYQSFCGDVPVCDLK